MSEGGKRKSVSPSLDSQTEPASKKSKVDAVDQEESPLASRTANTLTTLSDSYKGKKKQQPKKRPDNYNRRGKARYPGANTSTRNDAASAADSEDKEKRLPKRKVAVRFGYSGTGYSGSQINPGVKTIEGQVFDALVKAGCVSADNSIDPTKVALQRSARTDAGVHAAVNVLSLKLILTPPGLEEPHSPARLVDYINTFLQPEMRIWDITRVQNGFSARMMCDSRCYDYLLPTYVFLPPRSGSPMAKAIAQSGLVAEQEYDMTGSSDNVDLSTVEASQFWSAVSKTNRMPVPTPTTTETAPSEEAAMDSVFVQEQQLKRQWRIGSTPQLLEDIREAAKAYEGSHNFHNFTVAKDFHDRSANRVMKKLTVIGDPFLVGDMEWISIKIHGQSFMLHQIRKMIGLLILVIRSKTPASLIPELFGPSKVHIPKAPALGLLLEKPLFSGYNKRVTEFNKQSEVAARRKAGKAGSSAAKVAPKSEEDEDSTKREQLLYPDEFEAQVEQFKKQHIYDKLYQQEKETFAFAKFLSLLDATPGPDFAYLNAKGIIPPSCVFVDGKLRGDASNSLDPLKQAEQKEDDELVEGADEG